MLGIITGTKEAKLSLTNIGCDVNFDKPKRNKCRSLISYIPTFIFYIDRCTELFVTRPVLPTWNYLLVSYRTPIGYGRDIAMRLSSYARIQIAIINSCSQVYSVSCVALHWYLLLPCDYLLGIICRGAVPRPRLTFPRSVELRLRLCEGNN